jgi:8-oxo-dGTP pyrophosphatase MutT (NUDIX family)
MPERAWTVLKTYVVVSSPWLNLIGESLEDSNGRVYDYWRVEKTHSAIIIPVQSDHLVVLQSVYRPGVNQFTIDFPGGRIEKGQTPRNAALNILDRELGVDISKIFDIEAVNPLGWSVNSSFSSQRIFGFVCQIDPKVQITAKNDCAFYPTSELGVSALLKELTCLQCRCLLLEWERRNRSVSR